MTDPDPRHALAQRLTDRARQLDQAAVRLRVHADTNEATALQLRRTADVIRAQIPQEQTA